MKYIIDIPEKFKYTVEMGITQNGSIRSKAILNAVKDAIPYEPRPHGKWITTSNPNHSPFDNTSEFICICSKCTYSSGDRITAYWNFCPNCGADMRKEGDEK